MVAVLTLFLSLVVVVLLIVTSSLSLESDENVREWFSKWLGDLLNYQNKTINKMNNIHD